MGNPQLEQELKELEAKKVKLQQQITEIERKKPEKKVLEAISLQRYFYFKAKPDVIFDRDSGYLWPDNELDISQIKGVTLTGENLADEYEVTQLDAELKTLDYLAFKGWGIPAPSDMADIIDRDAGDSLGWTLPNLPDRIYKKNIILKQGKKLIALCKWNKRNDYSVLKNFNYNLNPNKPNYVIRVVDLNFVSKIIFNNQVDSANQIKNVRSGGLISNQFFLVNKSLSISSPLTPNFDKCSKKDQEKFLTDWRSQNQKDALQVFLQNKLEPVFDKHEIAALYELLNKQFKLNIESTELEAKIKSLLKIKKQQIELLSSTFNYRDLLNFKQFDCEQIDDSVIKFANATIDWCTLLEEKMAEYQIRQPKLISEANSLTNELAQAYKTDGQLSDAENQLLSSRQTFMFERLSLNMSIPIANLAAMKIQCRQIKKQLFAINSDQNGLYELGQLATQTRPSFDLVAENSATMITDMLLKMEFYDAHRELIKNLINLEQTWRQNYQNVQVSVREKLKQACEKDSIEISICKVWLTEWAEKRWQVEECLQPLIEKSLEGGFEQHSLEDKTPVVLQIIGLLDKYKKKLDQFFLHDRKSIHKKFAFEANSELQEKFEAESEMYKYTQEFQAAIHQVVFALDQVEHRLWLLRWSEPLINMTVDVILDFIQDKSLDSISKALIDDFSQLKLQNYATFINDAKLSAEMMSQWDKDYHSLMFKMRKELSQPMAEQQKIAHKSSTTSNKRG